jgi:DNA-binding CsgD family transcriptional regulator
LGTHDHKAGTSYDEALHRASGISAEAFPQKCGLRSAAQLAAETPAEFSSELGLTMREGEVLSWLSKGKTNRDIAQILGLAPHRRQASRANLFEAWGGEQNSGGDCGERETSKIVTKAGFDSRNALSSFSERRCRGTSRLRPPGASDRRYHRQLRRTPADARGATIERRKSQRIVVWRTKSQIW